LLQESQDGKWNQKSGGWNDKKWGEEGEDWNKDNKEDWKDEEDWKDDAHDSGMLSMGWWLCNLYLYDFIRIHEHPACSNGYQLPGTNVCMPCKLWQTIVIGLQ
jgi:hypothetical protein